MATILKNVVDTEDILADERVVDMQDRFRRLQPDETQFTTMLTELGTEEAIREKVSWLEVELHPRLSALAISATSALTALDVTTGEGQYFRPGDLVRNQLTGEMFRVVTVTTNTLGVVRGIGSVGALSSVSGAKLLIVSNASQQGADVGEAHIVKRVLGFVLSPPEGNC